MLKSFIIGTILMFLGQSIIWFQTNGQFIWDWFKKYPLAVAFLGVPASYIMIIGTKHFYNAFDAIWPGRLIGFACGILVFTALAHHVMGETVTMKTYVSLALAIGIVLVQVFMK